MSCRFLMAAAIVAATTLSARADMIVDQQNTATTDFVGDTSLGQSFTPTLHGIDFATFLLLSSDSTIAVNLYDSDGFDGNVLATSSPIVVGSSPAMYTFTFPTTVALTPGSIYTLQLFVVSGTQSITAHESENDAYPGGQEYSGNGFAQTGFDLNFMEGMNSTAAATAPEPTSLTLLGTGALGMVAAIRRRRCA